MKRAHRRIHLATWLILTPLLLLLFVAGAGLYQQTLPAQENLPGFDPAGKFVNAKGVLP